MDGTHGMHMRRADYRSTEEELIMKRTRAVIAGVLLFSLLLSGCASAVPSAERTTEGKTGQEITAEKTALTEAAPEETVEVNAQPEAELLSSQVFPAEDYSPVPAALSKGEVTPVSVQSSMFRAKFEGSDVEGSGEAVDGVYRFTASKTDGESWHVKLECNYPTIAGRDYFVTYRFHSDVAGTVKFGDFQEFRIREGDNSITGIFTAREGSSYLDLQLGMLPAFTIDFQDIEVKEYADEVDYENALPAPVNFRRESRVYERHDQGYDTIIEREDDSIDINYDYIPSDPGVWKSRLYIRTGMIPDPGVHYRVTADILSEQYDHNIAFEVLFNDGDVEKGYGALYGQELPPGEVKTCEAVITGNGNGDELVLQFSLGEARGGSLIRVGNVHVDRIIDHYTSVLPAGFALDKSVETGKMIEELVPVSYANIPISPSFYSGVDTVYEQHDDGYIVNLREGASSATMDIVQAPAKAADRGVWKARLYAATGVALKKKTNYRVRFDLASTDSQSEYEICFDGDTENAYGALYGRSLKAGGTDHIDMLITPDEESGPLTIRLQLGKTDTADGNTVTLKNLTIESVKLKYKSVLPAGFSYNTGADDSDAEYVSVLPDDFTYTAGVNVWEGHDEGYTQEVSANGSSATLAISEAPGADRGVWKSKLYINTGVTPEAGQKYIVGFDITADKDQAKYEVCFDSSAGENTYGALYDQKLTAGASQSVSYSFTPETSAGPVILRFQLGETDSTSGNTVTVSNLKIAPVIPGEGDWEAVDMKDFQYPTSSSGEPGYYPVKLPELTASQACDEGYEQTLSGMALTIGAVPQLPNEVWRSKLFADTGKALEAGCKYRVTADVTSEKAFGFELCFNNGSTEKGYGALYNQSFAAGSKTFVEEFTVPEGASTGNLILQFSVGQSPASNTITVNSVKVEKYIPEHEEKTTTPAGFADVATGSSVSQTCDSGYEQTLSGQTLTISAVPEDAGVWKSKLFVDTGTALEAGAKYKIAVNVTSGKAMDFEVCLSNGSEEKAHGALYGLHIGEGASQTYEQEFTAGSGSLVVQFQLGSSPADNSITVNSVKLQKWEEEKTETKTIAGAYEPVVISGLTVSEGHDQGYSQSVSGTALKITEVPSNGVWKSRLFVDTATVLEPGAKYKVTAGVTSAEAMDFEVCFNNGEAEKGYGALYGQSIGAGEQKNLVTEFTVPSDANAKNLVLQFQLGKSPAGNTFTVNSVALEKWSDEGEAPDVVPGSFELWAHEDYKAALGGSGSAATVRFDKVLDNPEVWKTKLFADTGVTLEAGKTYRISADVQATQSFGYEICYNDGEKEKEAGSDKNAALYGLTASPETQTQTYEVTPDADKHLIIQFSVGNAPSGTVVKVSGVKIEEKADAEGENLVKDSLTAWAPVHSFTDTGYAASLTNDSSSATMEFTAAADEKADWKAKLYVETGAKLKAGKQYRISYDIKADKAFSYHVFYGTGADEKAVGEFYNLTTGSRQKHVVAPEGDAELIIQLLIGYTDAPNKVKISNVKVEEIVSESGSMIAPINFWAHEDYTVKLSNTSSSASINVKKVPSTGREPWKVKLFAETGAKLKAGKTYRVSIDVKASKALTYDICYNDQGDEAAFGGQYGLQASTGRKTTAYNITPDRDGVLFLQLNLGNAGGGTKVTISGIKVEEVSYASAKNVIPNFSYNSVGYLSKASDEGYVTALEKNGSSATFRIKKAPSERHAWCAKVIVRTGITPKAGKGYRVSFNVDAAKPQNLFELFCDGNEELAYGALYEQYLAPGRNTYSYTVMPGDSKGELVLQLRFGETNGTDGNTYTISGFKFEEVTFVKQVKPEIKDVVENDTQDGYKAELTKNPDSAMLRLVETPEDGLEAWKNKLFVNTGVTLKPEQKYRVRFNVKSIIPAPFEVCFNNGEVEKGIGGMFGLTSDPAGTYIEFTTYMKEEARLVVQLSLGNCTTPNTIFLNDVKVEQAGKINLVSDTIYTF